MKTPLLLILGLAFVVARAAESPALEFRMLSWEGALSDLKFQSGRDEVAVLAQEYSLSPTYRKTDAATPLVLYRTRIVDGKKIRETVATVPPPPAGVRRALLLLARLPAAGETGETLAGRWLEDAPEAGTVRFHNLSAHPLAVNVADLQWIQASGETRVLPITSGVLRMQVKVASEIDGAWRLVGNISKPVRSHLHVIVLMREGRPSPDFPADPIELLAFYDEPPPPPKPPAS